MKKILCVSLAALLAILLSACVNKDQIPSANAALQTSNIPEVSIGASDLPEADTSGGQSSQGPIIAESSNTVSDKETEAILDELSADLESALGGAEGLEDIDNTDLDLNNIE